MDFNDREFHVSRILATRQKIKIGRQYYYLSGITCQQRFNSNVVFKKTFDAAITLGALSSDEILNLLVDNELWNNNDEEKFEKIPKDIEELKVKLYESITGFNSNEQIQIRAYLKEAKSLLHQLTRRRNQFEIYSANGIAALSKLQYQISCVLQDRRGNKISDGRLVMAAVYKYNSLFLDESQYREIARCDPWRNLWCITKGNKLFRGLNSELTDEQRILVSWSRIYDNVYKHHETPDESVVNDDDLLDGWFLVQKRQREKDSKQRRADQFNEKHPNAQEIFIPAGSREDAKKIDDMNDAHGKIIKRQRFNQLRQAGQLSHAEMTDVRQQLNIQMTQAVHNKQQ